MFFFFLLLFYFIFFIIFYKIKLLWLEYDIGEYGSHTRGEKKQHIFIQRPKRRKNMQFGADFSIYMAKK